MTTNDKKTSGRKIRGFVTKMLIGFLAFCGVGYISSAWTQRRCEEAEALSVMNVQLKGKSFYVFAGDRNSQDIFTRAGAHFGLYTAMIYPNAARGNQVRYFTWPAGKVKPGVDSGGRTASVSNAHVNFPFIVSVEYTAVYGSLSGGGATSYYLCAFGFPLKVREESDWIS